MQEQLKPKKFIDRLENPIIPWVIAAFFALAMIMTDIVLRICSHIGFSALSGMRFLILFFYVTPIIISTLITLILLLFLRWKRAIIALVSTLSMTIILFVPQCTVYRTGETMVQKTVEGAETPFSIPEQKALIESGLTLLGKQFPRETITNYTLFISNKTWFFRLESTQGMATTPLHFIQDLIFAEKKLTLNPPLNAVHFSTSLKTLIQSNLSDFANGAIFHIQSITLRRGYHLTGSLVFPSGQTFSYTQNFYFRKDKVWSDYPKLQPKPRWNPAFLANFEKQLQDPSTTLPAPLIAGPIAHTLTEKTFYTFIWKNNIYQITHRTHVFHHDQTRPQVVLNSDILLHQIKGSTTNTWILSLKERIPSIQTNTESNNMKLTLVFPATSAFKEKKIFFLLPTNDNQIILRRK